MDIVLASRNKKKIAELETILADVLPDLRIHSLDDVGFEGDIEENGSTFAENALIKARAAMEASGGKYVGVGDDSGLCVDALDGAPGIFSARYAGEHGDDAANNAVLLNNLKDVPYEQRTARFVCTIACVFPGGEELTVRGETEGIILPEAQGEGGFGYDPLFYSPPFQKTFAELSPIEKNAISHRGRALAALALRLKENETKGSALGSR